MKPRQQDARRLSFEHLTELRKRAVAAVQSGESPETVARVMGVSRAAVYNWLALYRSGGWGALDAHKRGGRKPKLSGKQMAWLYRAVTLGNPQQYQFEFALWTARMIGGIIQKKFGISLSKASVCRLLNQMGITPQRPLWRAYQQDPKAVEKWLVEEYPIIKQTAMKCGASIWFSDEAGIRSNSHRGTTWAESGKTPIVKTTGARFGINVISAVTARGDLRFMCYSGSFTAGTFLEFIKRLLKGATKPVYLIVDGHPTHKAASVRRFADGSKGMLRLFHLPAYSPELNPDELVWNDLKNNSIRRKVITGPDMLRKAVSRYLTAMRNNPEKVASYFRHPETAYAA